MRRAGHSAYLVIAGLFLAAVITQFFLAGLGVFGAKSYESHRDFGGSFHLFALLLLPGCGPEKPPESGNKARVLKVTVQPCTVRDS